MEIEINVKIFYEKKDKKNLTVLELQHLRETSNIH